MSSMICAHACHMVLVRVELPQASVSLKRLGKFLRGEELDPDTVEWSSKPAAGERGYMGEAAALL